MEILLEILLEIILQVFLAFLDSFFCPMIPKIASNNRFLAGIGYGLLGTLIGGMTIIWFPLSLIRLPLLKSANLIMAPLVAGFVMSGLGRLWDKKGKDHTSFATFTNGFLFALGLVLMRFFFAQ